MQFWRELPAAEQAAALAAAARILATWPTRAELVAANVAATPSSQNVAATPSSQNVAATPSSPKTQTRIAEPPSTPEGADNCDGASLPPQQDKIVLATGRRRYVISAAEFDRLGRLAQDQLAQKFDLPPEFPPRAREGLLGSLVLAAANETFGEEPYSDQTVAEIHLLLLKPE